MKYPIATERDFVDANNADADTLRAILPTGYALDKSPDGGRFYAVVSTPNRGRQMATLNVRDVADVPGVDAAYLVVRGVSWDKNWRLVLARAGEAPEPVTDDGNRQGVRAAIPSYRDDDRPDTPFSHPVQHPARDLPGEDDPEVGPRLATRDDGIEVRVQPDVSARERRERRKDRLSRHDPRHPDAPAHAL